MKKIFKKLLVTSLIIVAAIAIGIFILLQQPSFGKLPEGTRLERIKKSPHYKNDGFVNFSETPVETGETNKFVSLWDFIFKKIENTAPTKEIPHLKVNLKNFKPEENVVFWLGHSSIYMQIDGKKILIDPVLVSASPVSFINKPFLGSAVYTPDDIPKIDYLVITHDHWDHLDYNTVLQLKDNVSTVICPLGVGEHFEYWKYDPKKIKELDWENTVNISNTAKITAVPARHFSGRGLTQNKTLWAGYVIQSSIGNIYISGDTGYDSHFLKIKEKYGPIDLAIMENGQYDNDWKYIHMLPEDLEKAVKDLGPKRLMTVHNSKYVLAKHTWKEPLDKIYEASKKDSIDLIMPKIGETVNLNNTDQKFDLWWENAE